MHKLPPPCLYQENQQSEHISMMSKRTRKYTWNMEFVGLPQNTNGEDLEELKVEAKAKRTTQEFNQNNKNRHIKSTKT